jgi:hypothetical protein
MTVDETTTLLATISDAFPERLKVSPGMLSVWSDMLADLALPEAYGALKAYLADGPPHPPSISDIRTRCAASRVALPDAALAWAEVDHAMRHLGRDKEPKWSHPAIARAVDAIGWRELCNTMSSDINTVRAQWRGFFLASSETLEKRENVGRLEEHTARLGPMRAGELLKLGGGK